MVSIFSRLYKIGNLENLFGGFTTNVLGSNYPKSDGERELVLQRALTVLAVALPSTRVESLATNSFAHRVHEQGAYFFEKIVSSF